MSLAEQIQEQRSLNKKFDKLIETLQHKQELEFARYGKTDFFLFMEDVIGETKELKERWDKENT
jgi:hypothetical protein